MRAVYFSLLSIILVLPNPAAAQITIELDDLQLGAGASRSYLTHQATLAVVDGFIQGAGGPRVWNFSSGPSDDTFAYETMLASESAVSGPFVGAELAERLTIDSDPSISWTFYNLIQPGRELHGFHNGMANPAFPVIRLLPPLVDLPTPIDYQDQWTASSFYRTSQDLGGVIFPIDVDVTISSFVDAYGSLSLPTLGTVDVLRINELSVSVSVTDVGGVPLELARSFVRSHLFVSKEFGIVAQITSEAGPESPETEFEIASRFIRLSQSSPPGPPSSTLAILSIVLDSDSSVTLTWRSVAGTNYDVEVSTDLINWQVVGSLIPAVGVETSFTESPIPTGSLRRFYRVVEK